MTREPTSLVDGGDDDNSSSNPLMKLGRALKPSHIVSKIRHSHKDGDGHDDDQVGLNGGETNGHDSSLTPGKSQQRTEEKREAKEEKGEKLLHQKQAIDAKRAEEDAKARKVEDPEMLAKYGDLDHPDAIIIMDEVVKMPAGQRVTFRARIHTQRAVSSKLDFVIFRHRGFTVQGVLSDQCSPHMIKWVERLPHESIVQVSGVLREPPKPIQATLDTPFEVHVEALHLVEASHHIPFGLYSGNPPPQKSRLSNRVLDLRHPCNQAIFRIRAKIVRVFREVLDEMDFLEIQTPKLQPAATESGAEVFRVNYFGRKAFLAQSPQLAKQMAISADFGRVYEIGPVFRAENSNTHRHLTEYTGLDLEMSIQQDYHEVFHVLDTALKAIFKGITEMKAELARVRESFPSDEFLWLDKTLVLPFHDAVQMLRDDGRDVEEEDLSTPDEIRLGQLIHEKYRTDYYVIDRFPKSARPFYTVNDGKVTNSFDIFIRGQEVCTGGQRINNPDLLKESMREAGIDEGGMKEYLTAFEWGMPPHGGGGLGLERIVTFFLDLPNVRLASLFHRDPKSLPAREPSLPHPYANTLKMHHPEKPPPLEDLIANYGDATNTSWLDDRFKIWRDKETGAAVGYVPQGKFCMMTGDPLCDDRQQAEVSRRFLQFVKEELQLKPVWMLVSEDMQDVLSHQYGWRAFSVTAEQRSSSDEVDPDSMKKNKEAKGAFKVRQVELSDEFTARADKRIEEWKSTRNSRGKQVHLTEIAPWKDSSHRQYFVAESVPENKDEEPVIHTLVVLARLAPKYGYQLKWALDFPDSPNGAIEASVHAALNSVPGEPVTFGAGVSERFVPAHGIGGFRAKFMDRTYRGLVKSLALDKKAGFREKFGVKPDSTYICFPKHGVKATELGEIVKFFEE